MTSTLHPLTATLTQAPPRAFTAETAGFTKVLLADATLAAGQQLRLWPGLDISAWDRLHLTIGGDARPLPALNVRVLLSVPVPGSHCGGILTSTDIDLDGPRTETEFEHTTPADYGHTGFTITVPVVAPLLYDVILRNTGTTDLTSIYVTLFAQEI